LPCVPTGIGHRKAVAMSQAPLRSKCCYQWILIWGCAVIGITGFTNQADAVLRDWRGLTDTNWFTSNNWSPSGVPISSDDVLISTFVPSNFQWPFLTVFGSTTVRSVTVQAPTPFVAGTMVLDQGQLNVLNDFNVGVGNDADVILHQSSATLAVGGQIVVGSGGILDNQFGLVSQVNSQPIIIRGLYRQTSSSFAQMDANTLRVEAGGSVLHSKGLVAIANSLAINGGNNADYALQGTGNLEVPVINIGGSGAGTLLLLGSAQLAQTDTINVLSSGLFDIRKDFDFAGTLSLDNTTVKVKDGATAKTLTLIQSGLLRGKGTVDGNLINDANVDPGLGFVGSFTLTGDYQQTAQGRLSVDLAGTTSNLFDHLDITGNITLGGNLKPQLVSSFVPSIGDRFDIINFSGTQSGAFGNAMFPAISSSVGFGLIYDTNAVALVAGLKGDLDGSGLVDILDLNIVLSHWNQVVTAGVWLSGDPVGDGLVDILDLNTVLSNWNAGAPPSITVPEPAGVLWLGLGMMGLLVSGRRVRPLAR